MLDRITSPDSPFISEGIELLISEFGRDYSIYFSILQLIASGKTIQSEIDSIIGKNTGAYLVNLEKEYSLIERTKPLFSRPESRKARWSLRDNFLRFWFRFIYPNQSLIEMGKYELLKEVIGKDYEQYSGLVLERYFRDKIAESERVTQIGSYWDRKGLNEIDLIAINDLDKKVVVAEIKRNPQKININQLRIKSDDLKKEFTPFDIEFKGFSMDDM
jgi:hypothetical protein